MLHKDLNIGINKRLKESQRWKLYYYYRNKIIFIKKFCPFNLLSYLLFLYSALRTATSLILIDRGFKNAILPFKGIISGLKIRSFSNNACLRLINLKMEKKKLISDGKFVGIETARSSKMLHKNWAGH